jgi:predicted amidohydrolase
MLLKRPKIWCSLARGFVIRRPASIATVISRSTATASPPLVSASHRAQASDRALDGSLETAGWVDLHAHVFEWMTTFGLPPDDAGSIPA